jgi:hypothetical protein
MSLKVRRGSKACPKPYIINAINYLVYFIKIPRPFKNLLLYRKAIIK